MNFGASDYTRGNRPNVEGSLIMPFDGISLGSLELGMEEYTLEYLDGAFSVPQTVDLLEWIEIPNPLLNGTVYDYGSNIANYVIGANDAVRTVEFIHNYELPVDLYCKYDPLGLLFDHCQTSD